MYISLRVKNFSEGASPVRGALPDTFMSFTSRSILPGPQSEDQRKIPSQYQQGEEENSYFEIQLGILFFKRPALKRPF